MSNTTDRIEKEIVIRAPRARVWRALTEIQSFSQWFGVQLAGEFKAGARLRGRINDLQWSHVPFEITVEQVEPEQLLSWRWHPHPIDPNRDYSGEPTTLTVFELSDVEGGTQLNITESGFDQIPADRRAEAYRGNTGGWTLQAESIARYVHADEHS